MEMSISEQEDVNIHPAGYTPHCGRRIETGGIPRL